MAKLNIKLKAKSEETKSQQIATQLAEAIQGGKVKPGEALPSERALGEQLGISRQVIRRAYEMLTEKRLVETHGTAGRRVRGGERASAAKSSGKGSGRKVVGSAKQEKGKSKGQGKKGR
jgi:GntR family transcriptional regulator / MocR family aminotransferase